MAGDRQRYWNIYARGAAAFGAGPRGESVGKFFLQMYFDLISRRAALRVLGLGAAAGLLAACGPNPPAASAPTSAPAPAPTAASAGAPTSVPTGATVSVSKPTAPPGRLRVTAKIGRHAARRHGRRHRAHRRPPAHDRQCQLGALRSHHRVRRDLKPTPMLAESWELSAIPADQAQPAQGRTPGTPAASSPATTSSGTWSGCATRRSHPEPWSVRATGSPRSRHPTSTP